MKQLTKRRAINQRLRSQLNQDRDDTSAVLGCFHQAVECLLRGKTDEAKRYADNATAQLTAHSIDESGDQLWSRFLLKHCHALCSAAKEQHTRAEELLREAGTMVLQDRRNQSLFGIINRSSTGAMQCRSRKYSEAVRNSKFVLENIDSINLAHRPGKPTMLAIRLLFEGMFHILEGRALPDELQETIEKAHRLSAFSNGSQHRLTKAIERCLLTFGKGSSKPNKKVSTLESETKVLLLSRSHIRNSQSGCGSRMQLNKKNSALRTKHPMGRSHDTKGSGAINTTETYRLKNFDQHGDNHDVHIRNPVGSPFRKEKKELFEIYNGEKKKRKSPQKRPKPEDEPDEMRQLQRIKKIYKPTHSNNKIEYSFEPGLLQRTSKLEFLMIPVNKSLCLEEEKKTDFTRIVQNRSKHRSDQIEQNMPSLRIRKNTDAFMKVRNSTKAVAPAVIKKNYRIGVKGKRNTQTPTLITLSSLEDVQGYCEYDPSPTTNNRYQQQSSQGGHRSECGLI